FRSVCGYWLGKPRCACIFRKGSGNGVVYADLSQSLCSLSRVATLKLRGDAAMETARSNNSPGRNCPYGKQASFSWTAASASFSRRWDYRTSQGRCDGRFDIRQCSPGKATHRPLSPERRETAILWGTDYSFAPGNGP